MKGVQDALRRLDGVGSVQVDLQSNLVVVTPAPEVELDLAAIPAAIRRAGFTPAELEIVARGTFEERDGGRAFRIRAWTRALAVRMEGTPPPGETELHARVDVADGEVVLVPLPP